LLQRDWLLDFVLLLLIALCMAVCCLLAGVACSLHSCDGVRFARAHSSTYDLAFSRAPCFILASIAMPSLAALYGCVVSMTNFAVALTITGSQWHWSYDFDAGCTIHAFMAVVRIATARSLETDNHVVLPIGQTSCCAALTRADVLHC